MTVRAAFERGGRPFWLGEIERLLEAHGVSLRLPTRNERFPFNLVQPLLVVKQRHVGITTV
jgi:hypothetical protein